MAQLQQSLSAAIEVTEALRHFVTANYTIVQTGKSAAAKASTIAEAAAEDDDDKPLPRSKDTSGRKKSSAAATAPTLVEKARADVARSTARRKKAEDAVLAELADTDLRPRGLKSTDEQFQLFQTEAARKRSAEFLTLLMGDKRQVLAEFDKRGRRPSQEIGEMHLRALELILEALYHVRQTLRDHSNHLIVETAATMASLDIQPPTLYASAASAAAVAAAAAATATVDGGDDASSTTSGGGGVASDVEKMGIDSDGEPVKHTRSASPAQRGNKRYGGRGSYSPATLASDTDGDARSESTMFGADISDAEFARRHLMELATPEHHSRQDTPLRSDTEDE